MIFVYREYWNEDYTHRPYTDMIHNSEDKKEIQLPLALRTLYQIICKTEMK